MKTVSAAAASTASEECIEILKAYEGFCKYPYEDYGQWTVGYGTRCPADKLATYKEKGITEEEAEELLKVYIKNYEEDINYFIKKYKLNTTQNQFDAMFLFTKQGAFLVVFPQKAPFSEIISYLEHNVRTSIKW